MKTNLSELCGLPAAAGPNTTWRTRTYTTHILIGLALIIASTMSVQAADEDTASVDLFQTQHQAGIRIGIWSNRGDIPAELGDITSGDPEVITGSFETNINSASAYLEAYFGYRLKPWLVGELSLGSVNRGSVTLEDTESGASDIGNLIIYPILAQLKLYTPKIPGSRLYPWVMAGGGLHYGRRSVQFTNAGYNYYSYGNWEEETGTNFNYVVGGGFDWPIAGSIGLDFTVKYMPINMSMVTIEKWDALAFAVGVKYLYSPK